VANYNPINPAPNSRVFLLKALHMERDQIKTIVASQFKAYYDDMKTFFKESPDPVNAARGTGIVLWDIRTEDEEQRDYEAGVTLIDYKDWSVEAYNVIQNDSIVSK
jgi:hypothetical protein